MAHKMKSTPDIGQRCKSFMNKFWKSRQVECNAVKKKVPTQLCLDKQLPSGSKYTGIMLGYSMDGSGTYTFPNGVKYIGEFKDSQFEGYGELIYKDGVIVRGCWEKGILSEREIVFPNGLIYEDDEWMYCKMPDRRFAVEYKNGLRPAGESYFTEVQPTEKVPDGHYDTGDGYCDAEKMVIKRKDRVLTVVRAPHAREQYWIKSNCRYGPDKTIGPSSYLYEEYPEPKLKMKPEPMPAVHLDTNTDIKAGESRVASDKNVSRYNASFSRDWKEYYKSSLSN